MSRSLGRRVLAAILIVGAAVALLATRDARLGLDLRGAPKSFSKRRTHPVEWKRCGVSQDGSRRQAGKGRPVQGWCFEAREGSHASSVGGSKRAPAATRKRRRR